MSQYVYYVRVQLFNPGGCLVDTDNSISGQLPIIYKSRRKAAQCYERFCQAHENMGYSRVDFADTLSLMSCQVTHPVTLAYYRILLFEVQILI